jgi:hypothetical protein
METFRQFYWIFGLLGTFGGSLGLGMVNQSLPYLMWAPVIGIILAAFPWLRIAPKEKEA